MRRLSWFPPFAALAVAAVTLIAPEAVARPSSWSEPIRVDGLGMRAQGMGLALARIDDDPRPELVVAIYADPSSDQEPSANVFRYRIGWNIDANGRALSWSDVMEVPGVGTNGRGAGAVVTDLDANGRPDLLLLAYDDPEGQNMFRYRLGLNLGTDGKTASWGGATSSEGAGNVGHGAGVGLGSVDGDPRPDLVVMAQHRRSGDGPNAFRYRVGWNADSAGTAERWSLWRQVAGVGDAAAGADLLIADVEGGPQPDLLMVAHMRDRGFRYRVARDLDAAGAPAAWGTFVEVPNITGNVQGIGVAWGDIDENGRPELLLAAYEQSGQVSYLIGRDWNRLPPRLEMAHDPIHPGPEDSVRLRVTARSQGGVREISVSVDGTAVRTCSAAEGAPPPDSLVCEHTVTAFADRDGGTVTYSAEARDDAGERVAAAPRAFAVGRTETEVVPLWYHGSPGTKVDVVFLRDSTSYSGNRRPCAGETSGQRCGGGEVRFLEDVAAVIDRAYMRDETIRDNIHRFNFWYMKDPGTVDTGCNRAVPPSYYTAAPFSDTGAFLHRDRFRDCAQSRIFSVEPYEHETVVHESGHSIFGLGDIYPAARNYHSQDIWSNVYRTRAECHADADRQGWARANCRTVQTETTQKTFWVSDRATDIMGSCQAFPDCIGNGFNFDRGSRRRVIWRLEQFQ